MSSSVIVLKGDKELIRLFSKIENAFGPRGVKEALSVAAEIVRTNIMDNIKDKDKKLEPISWVTVLFRKKNNVKKFESYEDVKRYAKTGADKPLQDTGVLRARLGKKILKDRAMVGFPNMYKNPDVKTLLFGGTARFELTRKKLIRFKRNFKRALAGSKPAGSKAKRNWNPNFFILLKAFVKWDENSRTFKIPPRNVLIQPGDVMDKIKNVFLQVYLKKIGSVK